MSKILVTDAQYKASLAIIRSLGKKNIKITAGSEIKSAMGLFSRYCYKKLVYPNPRINPSLFLKYLLSTIEKDSYECIIPTHTYTAFLLAKYRKLFSKYTRIPPPDFDIFIKAYDKKLLLKIAIEKDIACPMTYFFDDLDEIVANVHSYPVVVKPSRRHGIRLGICNMKSELKEKYLDMSAKYGPCLVQEYIPNGGEFGVYTILNHDSEPIALTVHRRIRTLYPYGGASTMRETVKKEELVQIALNLLKDVKWTGVAMVEFRIDARDGTPKLMEINPRFWGSLQLSILSGVDFPYLLYELIIQETPLSMLKFEDGIQCRWLRGDITSFFQFADKKEFFRDFLRTDINYDVLSLNDPLPLVFSMLPPWGCFDEEPRQDDPEIMKNIFLE